MLRNQLAEIACFVEVAHRLSFAQAAVRLGMHVSGVSRAVAALESRLGVRLLQRTTRQVGLTEAGRAHLARCEAVLAEIAEAEAAASATGGALRGRLRASIPSGLGLAHLTPRLGEFLAAHPELELDLHLSNRNVDLVEEAFDVAIRVGELRDSRLVARRLGDSRRILVASAAYLAAAGRPRRPADLDRHACLVLDVGAIAERWELERRGHGETVRVRARVRSNNALALLDACRVGVGIALLPQFAVADDLAAGRLVRVLDAWAAMEQGIFAIYPGNRFIPAKVRAFVEFVETCVRGVGAGARPRARASRR
ncbi:LysR family transcriptional regulator [Dokdonella fugitiva]|jgi:DNA-binding transcriptional LysR family regulator|uniref:DNA-binding transcriptional LysR family regulator n=1 Tax=Dokdonella fugitiva TaxID=328517 RepID=A0A4R2HYV0_9GAMM|nr:LysR family transcriptional regulator [Dokdonella fugitiva]TCO36831.1 DNA-binding transcriptional LysR family regulator [Dokdonella fugitiva]